VLLDVATFVADAPSAPASPLAWIPYVIAAIGAVLGWRLLPNQNARTVGETLGGMADRLEKDNDRLWKINDRMDAMVGIRDRRVAMLEALLREHRIPVPPTEADPDPVP
jgi:hypothetical protein